MKKNLKKRLCCWGLAAALFLGCGLSFAATDSNSAPSFQSTQGDTMTYSSDLADFLTSLTIKDKNGNLISTADEVDINNVYTFAMRFSENPLVGFLSGTLTYTFPAGINMTATGDRALMQGNRQIGVYAMNGNTITVTPWYTGNRGESYHPSALEGDITFMDIGSEAWLEFEYDGRFTSDGSEVIINFGANKSYTLTIVDKNKEPAVSVRKDTPGYDAQTHRLKYTVAITVTGEKFQNLSMTDTLATISDAPNNAYLSYIQGSLRVYTGDQSQPGGQTTLTKGVDYTVTPDDISTGKAYTITFAQQAIAATTYYVEYQCQIDAAAFAANSNGFYIGKNTVTAITGGDEDSGSTDGRWINISSPLVKGKLEQTANTIKWQFTVEGNGYDIAGKAITDAWQKINLPADAGVIFNAEKAKNATVVLTYADQTTATLTGDNAAACFRDYTADGFIFTVPGVNGQANPPVKCVVTYETEYTLGTPTTVVEGKITNTITDDGGHSSSADSGVVTNSLPTIQKITTAIADDAGTFSYQVTLSIPKVLKGVSGVYLKDTLQGIGWASNLPNVPQNITIEPGTPGVESFSWVTDPYNHNVFYLLFNVAQASTPSNSTQLKALQNASVIKPWEGDGDLTLTLRYTVATESVKGLDAYDMHNTAVIVYPTGSKQARSNDEKKHTPGKTKKTGVVNGSVITYTVVLNDGFGGQITDGMTVTDTFDPHLEYVEDSLQALLFVPGTQWWGVNVAVYDYELDPVSGDGKSLSIVFSPDNWFKVIDYANPYSNAEKAVNANADSGSWYTWHGFLTDTTLHARVTLTYQMRVKDVSVNELNTTLSLKNDVTSTMGSASATVDYTPVALDKAAVHSSGSRTIKYAITVNPHALDLLSGQPGSLLLEDKTSPNLNLNLNSLRVLKADGSDLSGDQWQFSYTKAENGEGTLSLTLPNKLALKVVYEAYVSGSNTTEVTVKNNASLNGKLYKSSTSNTFVINDASGAGGNVTRRLYLQKVDAEDASKTLSGARLDIFFWNESVQEWRAFNQGLVSTDDYLTVENSDGGAEDYNSGKLATSTLYKIVETKAPDGYDLLDGPIYFGFKADDGGFALIEGRWPSGVSLGDVQTVDNYGFIRVTNRKTAGFDFNFVKVDGATNALLTGAEFTLTDDSDPTRLYPCVYTTNPSRYTVTGLKAGVYTLTETKAPAGYLLGGAWRVTVAMDDATHTLQATVTSKNGSAAPGTYTYLANATLPAIPNPSYQPLPATGGMGTQLFTAVGLLLMLAAAWIGLRGGKRAKERKE